MRKFCLSFLCLVFLAANVVRGHTLVVATADSSAASRERAAFVGDGHGDQEEIHAALAALPASGGTVELAEGTYDI